MSFGFGFSFPQLFGSSGAAPVSTDASFPYVSLLTPGNGTNAAQNNTFLDSSTNNFTITRNGTPTQGTFTPFSQTGWGGVFVGVTDALTQQTPNAVYGYGTGDFTIEFWVFPNLIGAQTFVSNLTSAASVAPHIYYATAAGGSIRYFTNSVDVITGTALSIGSWYHIAVSRTSGSTKMFINGTQAGSTYTDSNNYGTSNPLGIGDYGIPLTGANNFNGYMSNVRIVKGVGVYTGTFTPPAVPLAITQSAGTNISAITGTQTSILTLQSNRFNDQTAANQPLTLAGTPSIQAFSSFEPTAAYSAATNGGTVYFNGSTDYLTIPTTTALSFGVNDFTVECWAYKATAINASIIDARINTASATPWALFVDVSNFPYFYDGAAYTSTIAIALNTWNHIAVTRSSTTLKVFVNGVVGYTNVSVTTNLDRTAGAFIGSPSGGTPSSAIWDGYISNLRIVKGTAVYTANFTPPTAPLTTSGATSAASYPNTTNVNTTFPAANISLLLNDTGGSIIDLSGTSSLNTVGDARLSNSQKKYGTSSIFFNGSTSYLNMLNSLENNFGTGPFTIEFWMYPTNVAVGQQALIANYLNASVGFAIQIYLNKLIFSIGDLDRITGTTTLISDNWYHVAVSGASGSIKMFLNGVQESTTYTTACTLSSTAVLSIGRIGSGSYYNGYLDDIRLTHSILYPNTPFNVPTTSLYNSAAYSTTSSVDYSQLINY